MKVKKEVLFCVDCGTEVPNSKEDLQWHKDVGHRIVPRDQVTVEGDKKPKQKEKDERTASKKALDFALTKIKKLVISENNSDEVYAIVEVNNHVEAISLSSVRARYWLNDEYSKNIESNEIHADDFFKTVLNHIIAKAQMNGTDRVQVHNRIAQADGAIYYDLGTQDWQLIKITQENTSMVKFDLGMPVFRRTQSLQKQVIPKDGDEKALDKLVELLHIVPRDRIIFKTHLVALFLEAYPIPMMVFDGMAGSLKTTATATIKRIVDPNGREKEDNVSAMAEKQDDLILQLQNRYLPSFDNIGSISPRVSDIICRAITGSNNPRRKLYTDDEESIHSFKRKIVLNGIIPYLDYPDLQSRLVNYAREVIDETNRITEHEFNKRLDDLLPDVLGQIFITLCKAMREYPRIKGLIRPASRMSDFEMWGEVISRVLGCQKNEFLQRYNEKLSEVNISSQDSYPIVNAIQFFMENKDTWEGTASSLYQHLIRIADDQGVDRQSKYVRFPKSPNYLTKELIVIQPLLRNQDIITESYHYTKNDGRFTKNASVVKIMKKTRQDTLRFPGTSSPSSPSSPTPDLGTKSGEDTGEDTNIASPIASPKKADSTHENTTSEDGEDGEATPGKAPERVFHCITCKAGPFQENSIGSQGKKIIDFHKNQGHEIKYVQEDENVNL